MKMRSIVLMMSFVWTNLLFSQAEVQLDTARVSIGQPAVLTISITYRADAPETFPTWPSVGDTLTGGIEILHRTPIDTIIADKALDPFFFKQSMKLTLTHWEEGFYPIVPFVFQTSAGTVETNALLLEVVMPKVDLEAEIEDIKDIRSEGLSLWEWLVIYWYWVVGAMALVAAIVLAVKFGRKKPKPKEVAVNVPTVSAEDEALGKLKQLLENRWWLNGMVKEHHSEVSEILRGYLEKRFGFMALELTTEEILREINLRQILNESVGDVSKILKLTDLVKFAKANPLVHENEEIVHLAMSVINRHRSE